MSNDSNAQVTNEHPIYFETTSDGQKWPACGCGEVQLLSDSRAADSWIAAHRTWKGMGR